MVSQKILISIYWYFLFRELTYTWRLQALPFPQISYMKGVRFFINKDYSTTSLNTAPALNGSGITEKRGQSDDRTGL